MISPVISDKDLVPLFAHALHRLVASLRAAVGPARILGLVWSKLSTDEVTCLFPKREEPTFEYRERGGVLTW